jgi:sucrose-6-phosphate hydrolase SacC (GH32 family)
MWCQWQHGREPQALLWSSKNLVDWRFVSEFYNGTLDDYTAVMTPETFTFPTGEQAFIWLGHPNTLWVTGTASMKDGELYKFHERPFNGNPSMGWEDVGGGTHCGQSEWDATGRRVQFMWLRLRLPDANYTGAQTIPREILLAPVAGSVSGLWFRPLPEMAKLHRQHTPATTSLTLTDDGAVHAISAADGLHCHLNLTVRLADATSVVSFEFRAGAVPSALGSVNMSVMQDSVVLDGKAANLTRASTVYLEVFIDSVLTELFVNFGERSLTHTASVHYVAGTAIKARSLSGNARIEAETWSMLPSIKSDDEDAVAPSGPFH